MAVIINADICTGCGVCADVCPAGAITIDELIKKAIIKVELCMDCGLCIDKCRKEAISMENSNYARSAGSNSKKFNGIREYDDSVDMRPGRGMGQGRGSGAGQGRGSGAGQGRGSGAGQGGGSGAGQGGGSGAGQGRGSGISGECLCPNCGKTFPHSAGVPCLNIRCPECGVSMIRK